MRHSDTSRRPRLTPDRRRRRRGRKFTWIALLVGLPLIAGGLASALAANNQQAAAAANPNCTLVVPPNPLGAQGLATPYQLVATDPAAGPCNEANANQSAFVEAAIVAPGGQVTLYDPLVVDQGTQPAAPTAPATVPAGSTVGIWFGFNGTSLTLKSTNGTNSLGQGRCVNGLRGSIFGQFADCNAPAFFRNANRQVAAGQLQIPAAGTAKDGLPCPTTRDFSVVDQDQSDNVVTHYLATANGRTAQNNAANKATLQNQQLVDLANGSDNLLLTQFIDPALGCTPWTRPDQSSDGTASAALPLDELSAAANQQAPIALVPLTDPMTLNNNNANRTKVNLYRAGVDMTPIGAADNGNGTTYCQNLFGNAMGIQRVFKDQALFMNGPSVDAAMANNLFTFLAMRANQSFTNLNCGGLLKAANPITLTTDGNGVVVNATFTPLGQTPPAPAVGAATPTTTCAVVSPNPAAGTTTSASPTGPTTPANPAPTGPSTPANPAASSPASACPTPMSATSATAVAPPAPVATDTAANGSPIPTASATTNGKHRRHMRW
ncbi:hypothetical protein [Streptacidiphilus jiangxiensis]|uniref:Uncharacterized protein n=1 Tax=Streptacidiphilus jiangxiensis TaxID=235985 RepID=A0A1H7T2V7_STRJI|nr:hypothetical protein [Streptacidiphilus jiangxiensis]SEL78839.1 hypothetical protein SAMN05414137_11330 [Streptacidiphilus jiangxiensis]